MKHQKGFVALEALLIVVILIVVVATGTFVYRVKTNSTQSLKDAAKAQPAISANRTIINASTGAVGQAPYRTTYTNVPADLQLAIVAQLKKDTPECVNDKGQIVSQLDRTQILDPEVIYDSSGYAQTVIGCGDGPAGIFAKVSGAWKFLAKTQLGYSCDVLNKYHFPGSLLALNNPNVVCFDKNNNEIPYNG